MVKKKVLVLNLDSNPVSVCTVQRAFLLIYLNKAQLEKEVAGVFLRTVTKKFPLPSVIKLNNYINVPFKGIELSRQNIFKRDNFTCQYCGIDNNLTIDHVLPRSKGGKSSWSNLVTACKTCNAEKGDETPQEAGFDLQSKPFRPSYIMFLREYSGYVVEEWEPYLHLNGKTKISW